MKVNIEQCACCLGIMIGLAHGLMIIRIPEHAHVTTMILDVIHYRG